MSRRLAVVVAHPDDDTFGSAGAVALDGGDPGFDLTVILATSGGAGQISDPSLATPETLGTVREAEDRASWRALGVEPSGLYFLRYSDGGVADVPRRELVGRIVEVLRDARPDVVVTFGPEGITGHTDHVVVGEAATEAFHRVRVEGGDGFHRLLYNALPQSKIEWFSDRLVERGMDPIDPTQSFHPRGVPDETIGVVIDCSPVWRRVEDALREHKTQNDAEAFPEDLMEPILSEASYVQAWPHRPPGSPVLAGIFEGLDE